MKFLGIAILALVLWFVPPYVVRYGMLWLEIKLGEILND